MESQQTRDQRALHLAGLAALSAGGLLELSALSFWGLDLLIGALFAVALLLGALDSFAASKAGWGFFTAGLGALALCLHLLLSLDCFFGGR